MSTNDYVGPELIATPSVHRIVRRAQYEALKAMERDFRANTWHDLDDLPELLGRTAFNLGIPWPEMTP